MKSPSLNDLLKKKERYQLLLFVTIMALLVVVILYGFYSTQQCLDISQLLSVFVAITIVSNGKLFEKLFEKKEPIRPELVRGTSDNLLINTI